MQNLLRPRWMAIKALLFVVIAGLAATVVLWQQPSWTIAACLALLGWACSRAYYFAFYVIEHYVDRSYRFAGLVDFAAWWCRRRRAARAAVGQPQGDDRC
jgi:hypothetical protein